MCNHCNIKIETNSTFYNVETTPGKRTPVNKKVFRKFPTEAVGQTANSPNINAIPASTLTNQLIVSIFVQIYHLGRMIKESTKIEITEKALICKVISTYP